MRERVLSPELEIAHVLFMDLVGYSRLPMEEQRRQLAELQELVRGSETFQRADASGELLCLPTGDGMALVFFRDPVAPLECALEIGREVRARPYLRLRMGLHSGPVYRVADINASLNVSGGGINLAQRVMDCGDAGHILLSSVMGELLAQVGTWPMHDLGECEVKHGERLHLFNLYTEEAGNPALPPRCACAPCPAPRATPEERGAWHVARDASLEPVGGAVALDSRFYIVRPVDEEFGAAIARQDSIVLVKGARQMGKTSLLARGLQRAREADARVFLTDFQMLNAAHLETPDTLFRTLADGIADQLELSTLPQEVWEPRRGPNVNLQRYFQRVVLREIPGAVVWGLDEVDRLFQCPFASEVFGLFRSWHNARSLDPSGPWSRLTLAIAYATEHHLFITDVNQSPFNVGTRLSLADFDLDQVAELNRRHGSPLESEADVARFFRLVGGQPYLVRQGLLEMVTHGLSIADLEAQADRDEGMYGDHLRRMLVLLVKDPELCDVLRGVLAGKPCPTPESFYRLRSAGVIAGDSAHDVRPRCPLYATYLKRHLL